MAAWNILVIGLIATVFMIYGISQTIRIIYTGKTKKYLNSQFTLVSNLNTFKESQPRAYCGYVKSKHAVLLLHGYSASPDEFQCLFEELKAAGIPYYAPLCTGFGMNDFHLLYNIKPSDWVRDAINGYDFLTAIADDISVVGHSNGGALATYVAQNRPVKHLVLIGPNLMVQPEDELYKKLLGLPLISHFIECIVPLFKKPVRSGRITNVDTRDPDAALRTFHYPFLPLHSLKVLWSVQDMIDITKANFKTLTLMFGEDDHSVDIHSLVRLLDREKIAYNKFSFRNSGHNVLEDYDKEAAVKVIVKVITETN